jgi:hypothetical protein
MAMPFLSELPDCFTGRRAIQSVAVAVAAPCSGQPLRHNARQYGVLTRRAGTTLDFNMSGKFQSRSDSDNPFEKGKRGQVLALQT